MLNQLEARLKHHIDIAVHGPASPQAKMASDTRRTFGKPLLLQSSGGTNVCTPVITHAPRNVLDALFSLLFPKAGTFDLSAFFCIL